MAHVEIRLVLDGGAEMTFFERSAYPITDGAPAVVLAQAAYVRLARACGLVATDGGAAPEELDGDGPPDTGEGDPPAPGEKEKATPVAGKGR